MAARGGRAEEMGVIQGSWSMGVEVDVWGRVEEVGASSAMAPR